MVRIKGRLRTYLKKRLAERRERKAIYRKEFKKHEPKYIRQKAMRDVKDKYAKSPAGKHGLSWKLPQAGQRSVGQNLLDNVFGSGMPKKKSKRKKK